jgi:predicted dehydrogenase
MTPGLRVGIIGCGLIGRKRAEALRSEDELVGCFDVRHEAAVALAADFGSVPCDGITELLASGPDVVIVATSHDHLAELAAAALEAGANVLVEKPAGLGSASVARVRAMAESAAKQVKVGFNHRFHPAIARLADEVHSGVHGDLMYVRARYGHGGRPGYEREWRADPARSGGGELIDQGMHLLDLVHWLAGPLPLHSALLRTHFWMTEVDDNAVLILGDRLSRTDPWAVLHVSWTEWKNMFSLEAYCRRAKLQVDGLVRSYGTQRLRVYRMGAELGPPSIEEVVFDGEDHSWRNEWDHFARVLTSDEKMLGSLEDAHYAWQRVEDAYAAGPYSMMREGVEA